MVSRLLSVPIALLISVALFLTPVGACFERDNVLEPPENVPGEDPVTGSMDVAVRCKANVKAGSFACGVPDEAWDSLAPQLQIVGEQGKYVLLCPDDDYADLCPVDPNVSYAADTFRVDVTIMNLMDAPIGTPDGTTPTGIRIFFHVGPHAVKGGEVTVCNAAGVGDFLGTGQHYFELGEILMKGERSLPQTWKFCVPPTVEGFRFEVMVHAEMPPHLWFFREPEDIHREWQVFSVGSPICPIEVEARDPYGNTLTEYPNDICLEIGDNPGDGVLGGTVCKTPVDGRATFTDISIDALGSAYTLLANSDAVVKRESFPFGVSVLGDLDGGGTIDTADVAILLGQWGPVDYPCAPSDLNKDGFVDVVDLGTLLSSMDISTDSVSAITPTGATLHGGVNPKGNETSAWFEWGTDAQLTNLQSTGTVDLGSGTARVPVSSELTGLSSGTDYYFRVVALSGGQRRQGKIRHFHPPVAEVRYLTELADVDPAQAVFPAGYPICPSIGVEATDGVSRVTTYQGVAILRLGAGLGEATLAGDSAVAVNGLASFDSLIISQPGDGYTLVVDAASRLKEGRPFNVSIAGDLNLDDRVDLLDLDTLLAHWEDGGECIPYDINKDGFVDVVDLGILLSNWTGGPWRAVSSGGLSTCAITTNGEAYCWGDNGSGQLGAGAGPDSPEPIAVSSNRSFQFLSTGADQIGHSCGITGAGDAYCWGANRYGQLGDGTTKNESDVPVQVVGGLQFSSIGAGADHSCGVATNGATYCWGHNQEGQLGIGSFDVADHPNPEAVVGGLSFEAVVAGVYHACGITAGGDIYCWGSNQHGQLGIGTQDWGPFPSPTPIDSDEKFRMMSAGGTHTCAITTGDAALCWGYNQYGQLGDGTTTQRNSPVAVQGGHIFRQVAAGGRDQTWSFLAHTCGLTTSGVLYCWGNNSQGQLGIGTSVDYVAGPEPAATTHKFRSVSAGNRFSCGVTSGGDAYCWGDNVAGQLGIGTTQDQTTPVRVLDPQ